ncbi:TetR/AcrR family transcriptional regulator [Actinomadura montaniterrae]|uniref:TetR family transcriptional regulator n=1 Tax=Actinomadura montaniterrae TaxID=1803903 RepID=A0A6L3VMV3_9ACTN|nr:TetR/AcrR family transcriptional regulator [Actinomadura montaniterrae]KAB2375051.1 TetR family transcriptional regulator [Actinomadura montaniterrae]
MPRTSDARERLVRSAARLFLTRSYQSVGVEELCAAADVRRGSFYHFFPAKSDLAKAVIDHHAAALWARLDQAAGASPASDGAAEAAARLHAMADAVGEIQAGFEARFGRVVGCPFGNLAAELATTEDGLRAHLAAVFAGWERRLAVLCRAAADRGALRDGVDPDLLATILVAQFQGMILLAKTGRSDASQIPRALHQVIAANLRERA